MSLQRRETEWSTKSTTGALDNVTTGFMEPSNVTEVMNVNLEELVAASGPVMLSNFGADTKLKYQATTTDWKAGLMECVVFQSNWQKT